MITAWFCFNCTGIIFPFNHYLDDDEFKFALFCFSNSVEFNNLLNLKLNPSLYDNAIRTAANDNDNLSHFNAINSCSYTFDPTMNLDHTRNGDFSIFHLNSRSFNRNRDIIDTFITNCKHTFSIIAMSETWFNEDGSNSVDIDNYCIINKPRPCRLYTIH